MFSVSYFVPVFSQVLGKYLLSCFVPFICSIHLCVSHSHVLGQSLKSSVVSIVVVMCFAIVLFSLHYW